MSVRLCFVSVIGLCYILCILQHIVQGAVFFPDTVYNGLLRRAKLTSNLFLPRTPLVTPLKTAVYVFRSFYNSQRCSRGPARARIEIFQFLAK